MTIHDTAATISKRKERTKTIRRVQELLESPREQDIIRLQQELKLSNATARELDEVILYKNQGTFIITWFLEKF